MNIFEALEAQRTIHALITRILTAIQEGHLHPVEISSTVASHGASSQVSDYITESYTIERMVEEGENLELVLTQIYPNNESDSLFLTIAMNDLKDMDVNVHG